LKITFLASAYCWGPSGGMRVIYEHSNRLVTRGHEVSVVYPRRLKYAPPSSEAESLYYKVRRRAGGVVEMFCKPSINWQPVDPRVKSLYVPNSDASYIPDADVIFATAWQTVRSVLEYPMRKGEKFYLIQGYETFMGPKDLVDETWRSYLSKVAVSKWLLEVGEQLGCRDIAYVPNAIDQEHYRLIRPIEERSPRIAMAFSKVPAKASSDGIEALEIVRERYPDIKVVVFGATNVRPSIPKWIEYHCNPPQDFIVREIYNKSSIFMSSSRSEGWSLPPAEAATCGCAMVAADSGGIREYLENGVTGMLSQPSAPKSLAENLCLLLANDGLRVRLAQAGRKRVAEFNWDRSASLLERLLLDAVGRRQGTMQIPLRRRAI
jgi:glycosyltransferase involved in cell wall biosynthesis